MKAGAPFITSLLAASAAALSTTGTAPAAPISTGTGNYTISNGPNSQHIQELEKELQSLKQQLAAASAGQTCASGASGPASSGSGSSGPGSSASSAASAPSHGSGQATAQSSASSVSTGAGASIGSGSPSGSNTGSNAGSGSGYSAGSHSESGSGSNAGHNSDAGFGSGARVSEQFSVGQAQYTTPDFYAPIEPSSFHHAASSTCTVIVTPGQGSASQASSTAGLTSSVSGPKSSGSQAQSSDMSTVTSTSTAHQVITVTETYIGKTSIPSVAISSNTQASTKAVNTPVVSSAPYGYTGNGTASKYLTGSGSSGIVTSVSKSSIVSGNSTSAFMTGTATSSRIPTASAKPNTTDCAAFCSTLTKFNDWEVTPMTCTQRSAGTLVNTTSGQSSVGCGTSFTPEVDLCQVTLNVKTSGTANTYMEVWMPNGDGNSTWNGRTMSTDNGGLNGCVHYVDMQYVSGLGFAAIGDNAGHNGSSFDGTWTLNNNEAIVDWAWRARHASIDVGKQLVSKYYSEKPSKSYYIGCSAGGAQGLQSAQKFPNDFDGIISGASANDFNHLQDWNSHFLKITGMSGNDTFLTVDQWTLVQSYIFDQCDEKLDGVNDGILEDPTICKFDVTAIPVCNSSTTDTTTCLTATQIETVKDAFQPLYNGDNLIYPPLLYGAQVDAFKLGLLSGSTQGIARDFYRGGVYNDSSFDITTISSKDWDRADQLDDLHGNPSAFNADLGSFRSSGHKLMMYHGMADPMTSGYNSQRYYQKVAKTMGLSNTEIDEFMRFFRISGMAHCGVGGISGAGAWMFGQSGAASSATNNIVDNLVSWVENGEAPETLLGTKFWYDTPSMGIEFERAHCRYPYRTTYNGAGDATKAESWGCKFIDNWQDCEGTTCNADGTFT